MRPETAARDVGPVLAVIRKSELANYVLLPYIPGMPEVWILGLMGLAVAGAFVAKGATGFGDSLIVVPLFLLMADIKFVLPVVLLTTICADVYLLYHHHKEVHWRGLPVVIVTAVLGAVGGTLVLLRAQSDVLKIVFAVFVLLFAFRMLLKRTKKTTPRPPNAALGAAAGSTAGFIDAVLGTGGPPLIIYYDWLGLAKTAFRSTFVMLAFCLHSARVASYALAGLIDRHMVLTATCLVPPMVLGALLGRKVHHRLNETLFSRIAACVLLVVGAKLLLT